MEALRVVSLFVCVWVHWDRDSAPTLLSLPFDSFHFWWRSHWNDLFQVLLHDSSCVCVRLTQSKTRQRSHYTKISWRHKTYSGNFTWRCWFSSLLGSDGWTFLTLDWSCETFFRLWAEGDLFFTPVLFHIFSLLLTCVSNVFFSVVSSSTESCSLSDFSTAWWT